MIVEDRTQEMFGRAAKHESDPGYFYFADEDRQILGFAVGDVAEKVRSMGEEADSLLIALKECRALLRSFAEAGGE
ncbi:hypothetical protein [Agrobacterium tumefaciens]|uniref:hypothetical protein n=1 Tax=Agrobacterium tumefaciens TaxID=358 RepID=UPI0012D37140|nr:hypothetical protein [Agrobacterium tumefaciens]